jgi:hypothetical protein
MWLIESGARHGPLQFLGIGRTPWAPTISGNRAHAMGPYNFWESGARHGPLQFLDLLTIQSLAVIAQKL